ncbi:unnamed protein product [Sphenostylis stenocarpa]|uniref:Uncharacterized protein n=1 Tax=Sphenostylis stenocarpa TaxID=92480 RepID=A0AA86S308_9FABA|nr:unnamed protein product [Sphenostylis stenocarpa]
MQADPPSSSPLKDSIHDFAESSGKFEHDFIAKLKIDEHKQEEEHNQIEVEEENEDGEEEEEEFSFMLVNSDGSPISADDAFHNGRIRPLFPIFDQDLLFSDDYDGGVSPPMKLFVEDPEVSSSTTEKLAAAPPPPLEGSYCEWNPKSAVKSNSTGFSKLWRFRDVKLRSNSDGKDTLVFLNQAPAAEPVGKARNVVVKKVEGKQGKKTASSAHEKHYVMNRARKENDKRKSYLPYRPDLFGFFASSHGLSRNIHPY